MDRKTYEDDSRHYIASLLLIPEIGELIRKIEDYDRVTFKHSLNVAYISYQMCRVMKLPDDETKEITKGALIHDIGKLGISLDVLRKEGPLTDEEFDEMKLHTIVGRKYIEDLDFSNTVKDIILLHHEKIDGSGYPYGMADLPLHVEIVAVVDAYDAMTSIRPYKKPFTGDYSIGKLIKSNGFSTDIARQIMKCKAR